MDIFVILVGFTIIAAYVIRVNFVVTFKLFMLSSWVIISSILYLIIQVFYFLIIDNAQFNGR